MSNILSKKFNFLSLMKFTAPTIIMMVFMSMYTMVDGVFVSWFVGATALSAVNIVYPFMSVVIAFAIMLATGASAVIAKKMGEDKVQEAKENFTLIIIVGLIIGFVIGILGLVFIEPLITMLGANDAIYGFCYDYALILLFFSPLSILQLLFQYFFVTAGKPNVGLIVTVLGGCANIVLDYLFIVHFDMGISGAALATGIGYSIPGIYGLIYFFFNKRGTLYFVKPRFDKEALVSSCTNGSSEMVTNLSTAITTFLFNILMMKYLGEEGVAAITIILYAQFLLTAVYIGFSSGIAPLLSYNHGEGNTIELKKLFKMSMLFLMVSSVVIFIGSILFSTGIVSIFAEVGSSIFEIAKNGFGLFSLSYLFIGINIFASAMFTALSNGKVSAIISFVRTFLFLIIAIILLPQFLGHNGIWLSVPLAEFFALAVSLTYIFRYKKVYKYA